MGIGSGPCMWRRWRGVLLVLWLPCWAWAQDVPVPDGEIEKQRRIFDATEYESIDQFRELYERRLSGKEAELETKDVQLDDLRRQLERRALEQGLVTQEELDAAHAREGGTGVGGLQGETRSGGAPDKAAPRPEPGPAPARGDALREAVSSYGRDSTSSRGKDGATSLPASSLDGALVFDVGSASSGGSSTVVPAGSYVKVRILTGVEANPRDEIPMLVQADHALVGPNKRRIDLRGCMMLMQVKGELSTDRVVGQAVRLSCIRNDGESVTREINGYLAGEDSTFGVTGQLITRQGRVIAAAAVAGFAEAAGDAVARAQETRQLIQSPLSTNATEVRNVDGNQTAYVLGTSASGSAEIIANWYLKYADQLLPAIAVGSGRDVWVVLLETVDVPPLEVP